MERSEIALLALDAIASISSIASPTPAGSGLSVVVVDGVIAGCLGIRPDASDSNRDAATAAGTIAPFTASTAISSLGAIAGVGVGIESAGAIASTSAVAPPSSSAPVTSASHRDVDAFELDGRAIDDESKRTAPGVTVLTGVAAATAGACPASSPSGSVDFGGGRQATTAGPSAPASRTGLAIGGIARLRIGAPEPIVLERSFTLRAGTSLETIATLSSISPFAPIPCIATSGRRVVRASGPARSSFDRRIGARFTVVARFPGSVEYSGCASPTTATGFTSRPSTLPPGRAVGRTAVSSISPVSPASTVETRAPISRLDARIEYREIIARAGNPNSVCRCT